MTPTQTPMPDLDLSNSELFFQAQEAGDVRSMDALLPLVYGDVKVIAAALIRGEVLGCSIGATDLAHEAFLRLARATTPLSVESPRHACNLLARTMRRLLIERANWRAALRHGGGARPVPLDDGIPVLKDYRLEEMSALRDAMDRVRTTDPLGVEIAELRYLCGLDLGQVASFLEMSVDRAKARWTAARAELRREVSRSMETHQP